jgi:hypothetical protein
MRTVIYLANILFYFVFFELALDFRTPRKDTIMCQEVSRWQSEFVVDDLMHSLS